jgi:hypothetical protein
MGALALAVLVPCATRSTAQDGEEKTPPSKFKKAKEVKTEAAVEAWIAELVRHFSDKNRTIRASARAGLVGAGPAAVPALRKIAAGDDDASDIARILIAHIQRRGRGNYAWPGLALRDLPSTERVAPKTPTPPTRSRPAAKSPAPTPAPTPRRPAEQKKPQPSPRPERPARAPSAVLGRAVKGLDLTDKQKSQVNEILAANQKKVQELAQKVRRRELNSTKAREAMDKLQEGLRKDLQKVLTGEQYKKIENMLKSPRSRGAGGSGGRPSESGPTKPTRPGASNSPQQV